MKCAAPPLVSVLLTAACVSISFDSPPGPRAGEGSVTIDPPSVEASAETRLRVSYTVGEHGLAQGGGFRIELPVDPVHRFLGFTPPHVGDVDIRGAVSCAVRRGPLLYPGESYAEVGESGDARCLLATGSLEPGDGLVMEYWGLAPRVAGERELHVESRFSGGGGGLPIESPRLEIRPRAAAVLSAVLPSEAAAGESITLAVAALDEFGNLARDYDGWVEAELGSTRRGHRFTPDDRGVALLHGLAAPGPGYARALITEKPDGRDPGGGRALLAARSNPVHVRIAGGDRVFWGDLHFATGMGAAGRAFLPRSSCAGDHRGNYTHPREAFRHAREVARLDFAAAVEHAVGALTAEAWSECLRAAEDANDPKRFTALAGFQWRDLFVLLPGDRESASTLPSRSDDRASDEPAELAAALDGSDAVVIARRGPGAVGADAPRPVAMEIYSWLNRGDGYEDRPREREPGPAWLEAGIPAAVTAGSANHWGHPGTNDLTGLEPGHGGLTAVIARENTREAILDALRGGRSWATTGARIHLRIERSDGKLHIAAAGTRLITAVELVVVDPEGSRVLSLPAAPAEEIAIVADEPAAASIGFFFLRIVQQDGETAWSSPVRMEVRK